MTLSKNVRHIAWAGLLSSAALISCIEQQGGFNRNERMAGNGDDGVSVGFGEIAIDPTGRYLLSASEGTLVYGSLRDGSTQTLRGLSGTHRVAFNQDGRTIFVTRTAASAGGSINVDENGGAAEVNVELNLGLLARYDTETKTELWQRDVDLEFSLENDLYPLLEVSDDDSRLVLTYRDHVEIIDAKTGKLLHKTRAFETPIVDVDLTPDQKRVLITLDHTWADDKPTTTFVLVELEGFASVKIKVPNCADEVVITPNGKYALLAPTTCQPAPDVNKDPVSVIDLTHDKFVRNLPGFGPVALAPAGDLGIAFIDTENLDEALFDDKGQIPDRDVRYHLMLIDPVTLTFSTVELGDALPRYAVSPDGKLLLVDSPSLWDDGRIRVLDVKKRELAPIAGPNLRLDNYVITRDSATVFLLDEGLFRIALGERRAEAESITFTPSHLNITPDDKLLVLRENASTLWLYDAQAGEVLGSMTLSQ